MQRSRTFLEVVGILLCSTVVGLLYNHFANSGIPLLAPSHQQKYFGDSTQVAAIPLPSVKITPDSVQWWQPISLPQAYRLFERGQAIFIDARCPRDYEAGHIKGALNVPYESFSDSVNVLQDLTKDQLIIIYSDVEKYPLSTRLARELTRKGYRKVKVLGGGWAQWRQAHYPTERSYNR